MIENKRPWWVKNKHLENQLIKKEYWHLEHCQDNYNHASKTCYGVDQAGKKYEAQLQKLYLLCGE